MAWLVHRMPILQTMEISANTLSHYTLQLCLHYVILCFKTVDDSPMAACFTFRQFRLLRTFCRAKMCLPMVSNVDLVLPFRRHKIKCSLPFIRQLFNYLKIAIISPSNPVFSKDFVSTTVLGDVAKPHHFPPIPIKVMIWDSVQNQLLTSARFHCVIFWQFHQLLILQIKKTVSSDLGHVWSHLS